MCGIAGYFGRTPPPPERIETCQALMQRRGPDDTGSYAIKTQDGRFLNLLHSRLSIIDLNIRARQPFLNGNNSLCFNGEIYNYLELKGRLATTADRFTTSSDTEVLSELLVRDGIEGVSLCEGMWAFAWFDSANEQLYLCRDRFGEKPLYIYESHEDLFFGSEPKFIFALLGRKLEVNQTQLKRYLVNGYKSIYKSSNTFFEGLSEISPGTYKVYSSNEVKTKKYWSPTFDQQDPSISYQEAVSRVKNALIQSVELRLRSDVPIAFCLSGGVDSNALISIAKREFDYDVHGFTIMNTDSRYEERDMVEVSVKNLELRHTEVPISTANFLENVKNLINYHDAPIYTITYYAQWQLMQAIHKAGYKVSVSGTAADELFSGYFDHHNAYIHEMKIIGDSARYKEAVKEWQEIVSPIVRNPFLKDPDYFLKNPSQRDHIYLDADTFSEMLCEPFSEEFYEARYSESLLRNRMANELFHESVPVILHEDDLNAMYYSIENRSPFLDRMLFETCQSIPTRHLVRGGLAKSVLRDAVRGLAPNEVIDNPRKIGFNVPLFDYLDVADIEVRKELLADSPIFDVIKRDEIESILNPGKIENSRSKFLFNFICAKYFLENAAA